MPSFIGTIITRLVSAAAALCVVFLVLVARVVAHIGTYAVAFLARHAGTVSPFDMVTKAPPMLVAKVTPRVNPADYAAIENLINAKIPSKAERVAARDALQKLMTP